MNIDDNFKIGENNFDYQCKSIINDFFALESNIEILCSENIWTDTQSSNDIQKR